MASYNELLALIDAYINRNGVQAITGQILNGVLKAMVDQLGAGFVLGGVAHPADDPGTPEAPVCYFASEEGTYTHFGGLTIAAGEFALFCYDLTDGWYKETIYEGITEITASIDDQVGTPEVYVEYQNGVLSFDFRNMKGNTGDPAGFGNISADVDANIGTPAVTVSSSGPDTAKVLAFHFKNLKGETGVTSVVATVDNTSGNPTCAVSLNGQELHLDFTGLKGAQGDTGVSADYPIAIVNNLTTNDPTSALSAAMGVQLESEVSQLEAKVDELALGNFLGFYPSAEDLPTDGNKPGFAYVGTESPYSIYNYDGTTWTDSGATVKRGEGQIIYLEDFPGYASDLSPVAMRVFLQSAIDYVGQNKAMLIFPKGKTFTIDIPESHEDGRYDCEGGDGLKIPGNITIDFNYCTINIVPNHWYCYNILHILYDAENVILKNGNIVGDRDNHIMSNTISQNVPVGTDEWNYAIMVNGPGKDILHNMSFSDVRGDGIYMDGVCVLNHTIVINGANVLAGYDVDSNGDLVSSTEHITTVLLSLSTYYTSKAHRDGLKTYLVPRVAFDRAATNIEHSYYFKVSYYTEQDAFISAETVFMGDPMNIPTGAVKFRLTNWVANTSNTFGLWVMNVLWNENSVFSNCNITRCGRNGITPTTVQYLTISNCSISEIHGTNNQVGIDIEGTSYIQKHITIKDCVINNPGYNGIAISQGYHIIVDNCKMIGCLVASSGDDVHFVRCIGDSVIQRLAASTVYETDLIFPKCTFSNCDFSGLVNTEYSISSKCVFSGGVGRHNTHTNDDKLAPTFNDCRLTNVADILGYFNGCVIFGNVNLAFQYHSPIFTECKIVVPKLSSARVAKAKFYRCDITLTDSGNTIFQLATDRFVDNIVTTTSAQAASKVYFWPVGEVCIFTGNTYKGAYYYRALQTGLVGSTLSAANTLIFENNTFDAETTGATKILYIDTFLKNMKISFKNNVFKSNGGVTDFEIVGSIGAGDGLKIFTDNNISVNSTLGELNDSHIYRATWTPSVTP